MCVDGLEDARHIGLEIHSLGVAHDSDVSVEARCRAGLRAACGFLCRGIWLGLGDHDFGAENKRGCAAEESLTQVSPDVPHATLREKRVIMPSGLWEESTSLVQMKANLGGNLHGHGLSIFSRRFELPLAYRFNCFLVEAAA